MSTERSNTKSGPVLKARFSWLKFERYYFLTLKFAPQSEIKIEKFKLQNLNFSQAQLRLKLRKSCKRWTLCPPKARGKGASQAPLKSNQKGKLIASARCAEAISKFHFLGWQDGLQDFLSDVSVSCAYRKFPCVVRKRKFTEYSAERGRRNF